MNQSDSELTVVPNSEELPGEYLVKDEKRNFHDVFYLGQGDVVADCSCRSDSESCDHIEAVAEYREEHPPETDLEDFPERPEDVEVSIEDGFPSRPSA